MDTGAIYAKTPKGIEELQSRTYRLGLRARALLILVDGTSTAGEVIEKGKAGGNAAAYAGLEELASQGFIAVVATPAPGAPAASGLDKVQRFAVDQMLALLGPSADVFTARIEAAKDRQALFTELERCRQAVSGAAGNAKAEQFWNGVQQRLDAASGTKRAAPAGAAPASARSLASARQFAIERMAALPGPHGPAFVERLQSAADRTTLVSILERCRTAVQIATGEDSARRFWAGVEERLP